MALSDFSVALLERRSRYSPLREGVVICPTDSERGTGNDDRLLGNERREGVARGRAAAVMAVFARGNVFSCGKSSEMPRREERRERAREEGRKETTMGARGDREEGREGRAVGAASLELRS